MNYDATALLKLQKCPCPALSTISNITTETLRPLSDSSQIFKTNFALELYKTGDLSVIQYKR